MSKIMNILKNAVRETDIFLLSLCVLTSAFGITMVASATGIDTAEGALFSRDARTMLIAVAAGLFIAVAVSFIDYNFITKMFPAIGAVCIGLMLLTLAVGVGPAERPDAKTWIVLGSTGFYFQASELLKIGFIITFGMHLELVSDKTDRLLHVLLLCVHAAVPVGLVAISGDMGSALVFIFIFGAMMFAANVQMRYFIIGGAAVCAAVPAVWYFIFDDTQRSRILGLIYPDRYEDIMYQQNYGMKAIMSGGLTGQGLFNGKLTQAGTVPESENDMIFTCIAEELGFLGCVAALGLLLLITLKIFRTGRKSKYGATSLMCYGLAAMIVSQVMINIGMCLKILPVIGITLPFFSAGGSSNLCLYIGIGLALSIYRFDREREAVEVRLR